MKTLNRDLSDKKKIERVNYERNVSFIYIYIYTRKHVCAEKGDLHMSRILLESMDINLKIDRNVSLECKNSQTSPIVDNLSTEMEIERESFLRNVFSNNRSYVLQRIRYFIRRRIDEIRSSASN